MIIIVDAFDCQQAMNDLGIDQDSNQFVPAFEKRHDCFVHHYVLSCGIKQFNCIAYIEFHNEASYNLFALKYM
jgi:hypothetical protein